MYIYIYISEVGGLERSDPNWEIVSFRFVRLCVRACEAVREKFLVLASVWLKFRACPAFPFPFCPRALFPVPFSVSLVLLSLSLCVFSFCFLFVLCSLFLLSLFNYLSNSLVNSLLKSLAHANAYANSHANAHA